MDDDPAIARDEVEGLKGLPPAFGMEELQGDITGGVDMDSVVLAIDPQGGFIHVQGGVGEELVDRCLFPTGQGLMQLHHPFQEGRLRDG